MPTRASAMTIREEILFSLLVATAVVTGGELLWLAFDYVLG
jgi:hypothetical protein